MSIILRNIKKEFLDHSSTSTVLDCLELSVKDGESVAIIGPSGSGKSTLLHILGLLEYPTIGEILISGVDYTRSDEQQRAVMRRKFIGFIYQFHYLLMEFTVLENLVIPQLVNNVSKLIAHKRSEFMLERLGLIDKMHCIASSLSGGEQQRVAVARALINFPKFIVADEPTGNLDEYNAGIVARLLFEEAKESDVSLVLVTHNMEIAKLADRVLLLKSGKLVEYHI